MPFSIDGALQSGVYELEGDVSSQYVTGLLFALPLLEGDSEIRMLSRLESKPYVDLTIACLRDCPRDGTGLHRSRRSAVPCL